MISIKGKSEMQESVLIEELRRRGYEVVVNIQEAKKPAYDSMDMSELIDEYFSLKGPRSGIMEGAVGLRNMEKIVEIFGYRQGIRNFLQENSGALESILEWIREQDVEDWKEQLREELDKFATGE
jgi:hypothetical protein